MKRIYIATPISRGDLLRNIQQADAAFFALLAAGLAPFNPILSVYAGGSGRQYPNSPSMLWVHATADTLPRNTTHEQWVALGLAWVEAADAVLRLPGESVGADAEVAHAKSLGIPVYYSVEEVVRESANLWEHSWCKGVISQCIRCGVFKSQEALACDPRKLEGKTEWCCDCGEEYPKSDLIAGEIFCKVCRVKPVNQFPAKR